jgi:hypothetical protein
LRGARGIRAEPGSSLGRKPERSSRHPQVEVGIVESGFGSTRLEAALDSKARQVINEGGAAWIRDEGGEAVISEFGTHISADVHSGSETLAEGGTTLEVPREIEEKASRAATRFGWEIGFADEPDGSFTWFVFDRETDEILQRGKADNWDDAKLNSILDLQPPSSERDAGAAGDESDPRGEQ